MTAIFSETEVPRNSGGSHSSSQHLKEPPPSSPMKPHKTKETKKIIQTALNEDALAICNSFL